MKLYIELKQRQQRVTNCIIQLNFNIANNKDFQDVLIELKEREQDLKQFKQDNNL